MTIEWYNMAIEELIEGIYVVNALTEGEITKEFIRISLEDIRVFDSKQHDYGSDNISAFGEIGVLVRMSDKMARLKNLVWVRKEEGKNESINDSYGDISVYGKIARMCRKGVWPGG